MLFLDARASSAPGQLVDSTAFNIAYQPNSTLKLLDDKIEMVANPANHYENYLTIVQSSGYGKSRAMFELAAKRPMIYMYFRHKDSSVYPPATLHSEILLQELNDCKNLRSAEILGLRL